jgi:hypothetical protein
MIGFAGMAIHWAAALNDMVKHGTKYPCTVIMTPPARRRRLLAQPQQNGRLSGGGRLRWPGQVG